jgi:hypothetical protein
MSKVQLQGNASGTGIFTIASPNSNTDRTLTLPDNSGTLINTGSVGVVTSTMLAAGASNQSYFYAYRTINQTGVSSSVATQVQLDNALQSGTSFNTSTYTWTATAADAGTWQFTGQVSFYIDGNNGSILLPLMYYNSSLDAGNYGFIPGASTGNMRHFTGHIQTLKTISAGDTMKLYGYVGGTSLSFFGGDSTSGYRQCSLIGVKIA